MNNLQENLMKADSVYWAVKNRINLLGGVEFTLDGCQYMADIMRDNSRYVAVMKGTQARITTAFMLRSIHSLVTERYPQGVIYYFPSRDSVEDFSKTRFTPLISDNACISRHLKSTDSVFVKKVGKAFLTLKGATATMNLKGRKEDSTAVRSMPADEIIRDERDLFNQAIVDMMPDRLLNSTFKREVDLGSPTIPDFGIAKVYGLSDQKNMMHKCGSCGGYTCLVAEWPKCVKYERVTTHMEFEPYFACIKCKKPINNLSGVFKVTHESDISGYHVPHLITPNCELKLVMKRWEEAQIDGSKLGTFNNSILGLPHIDIQDRLLETDVLACCGNDVMRDATISQTALGADIGKHYHTIVIAEKVDQKRAKIIYMGRVKGFEAIHDLAKKFNVKSAVIDRRPYEEEFDKFQKAESYRVFGAEYKDRQKAFCKTDELTGTYSLFRTQIFDKTHFWVKSKQIEIPRKSEEVYEFAKQMCNCAKILEENEAGDRVYRYIKLGDDHYRSAVNYLYMALQDLTAYQGMNTPGWGVEEEVNDWNPITV